MACELPRSSAHHGDSSAVVTAQRRLPRASENSDDGVSASVAYDALKDDDIHACTAGSAAMFVSSDVGPAPASVKPAADESMKMSLTTAPEASWPPKR